MHTRHVLALIVLTLGCSGASRDPYQRLPISGHVTFDGEPISSGVITFFPAGRGAVASGASIINGNFQIPKAEGLPPGLYRASVSAPMTIGAEKASMDVIPTYRETIPKEYNSETTLEYEVRPDEENRFELTLTSSAKK